MRELEFLPDWYPKVRRHRRMVSLQAWITLFLLCGLGFWMLLVQHSVQAREIELAELRNDVTQSESQIERLEDLQEVQRELGRQMDIFAKIGRQVETTRVVTTLEELMPKDMALLSLTLETEEVAKSSNTLASPLPPRVRAGKGGAPVPTEPRLRFRLHGVAPTDMDLADFLAKLTGKPFFKNVELLISRERQERGHVMREFEVAFIMDLSGLGGR